VKTVGRARGLGIVETVVGVGVFSIVMLLITAALIQSFQMWTRTASQTATEEVLFKIHNILAKELTNTAPDTVGFSPGPSTWGVRDGDALWFLSFLDPVTGEPVYSDGTGAGDLGEPHWQRNIMYYSVVPGSHNSVAGQSCTGGDGGDGYEDQCPHKVMVRKLINDPNDPETLLPGSGGYLDAPSGFSVSGMGGADLEETRLLGTNILSFRVIRDTESVTVDLRANSIDEARKNVPVGSTPLSGQPTTIQRVFTIFPKNSSGEEP
jgi:hypothetical protein